MKISKLKNKISEDQVYNELTSSLLEHPKVQEMDQYIQHADTTVLLHSLHVSYISYRVSQFFGLDYIASARGGLLHDFFLYDWHLNKPEEGLHAFAHPKIALRNANEHFVLSEIETDIIVKHMWPVTIKIPKYYESLLITFVDKYCAISETYQFYTSKILQRVRTKFT